MASTATIQKRLTRARDQLSKASNRQDKVTIQRLIDDLTKQLPAAARADTAPNSALSRRLAQAKQGLATAKNAQDVATFRRIVASTEAEIAAAQAVLAPTDFAANRNAAFGVTASTDHEGGAGLTRAAGGPSSAGSGTGGGTGPALDPRGIQRMLQAAGFYHGAIDGIIGPQTHAALDAWEAAGHPTAPARAAQPAAPGGSSDVASLGSVDSGGAPSAVQGGPVAPGTPSDNSIRAQFPELSAFLDIPGLGDVIRQSAAAGDTPEQLKAKVQQTDWWKTHNPTQRKWVATQAVDPAGAQAQIADAVGKMKTLSHAYLANLADVTVEQWAQKVLSGEVPADGFETYLKNYAKSMYPSMSAAIDQGITPETFADPYRQRAAQTLEIDPSTVDLTDPKWSKPLLQIDPKTGQRVSMSLSDWDNELKTNPAYGYDGTQQARDAAAQFAQKIAQTFGKVA